MKIAYIVDSSTELTSSLVKKGKIFSVNFKAYNESGTLVNVSNKRHLDVLQANPGKQFIEPTPGIYRDLYKGLKQEGYDYIVCIPQNRKNSSSYINAEYASRMCRDFALVIDANEYDLQPIDILNNLISAEEKTDSSTLIGYSLEQLFDVVKTILTKGKLLQV